MKIKCPKCRSEFDPSVQAAYCGKGIPHYAIQRTPEHENIKIHAVAKAPQRPAGTSGIFNPPPPDTPEAASARLDELPKDPIWQERVKQNDPSARAEHLKLTRVRMGLPAEQQPSVNTFDVMTESIGRDLLIANTRADMMRDEAFF